jgi:hypothetical protein
MSTSRPSSRLTTPVKPTPKPLVDLFNWALAADAPSLFRSICGRTKPRRASNPHPSFHTRRPVKSGEYCQPMPEPPLLSGKLVPLDVVISL